MRKHSLATRAAMSGAFIIPTALGLGTGVVGAFAPAAHAAAVTATNVTSTMNPASVAVINQYVSPINVSVSWDVPNGTNPGDTTTITLPDYEVGSPVNNLQIKTANGTVIGTMTGSGNTYTVTYGDGIAGLSNVKIAPVTWPVDGNSANWTSGQQKPIQITVDGTTVSPGDAIFNAGRTNVDQHGQTGTGYMGQDQNGPNLSVGYKGSIKETTPADVGKDFTWTFKVAPDTTKYAGYDCDAVMSSGYNGLYTVTHFNPDGSAIPAAQGGVTYNNQIANGAKEITTQNPWNISVASCTSDTLTFKGTVPADGAYSTVAFNTSLDGSLGGGGVKLTPLAVAEQFTGPYHASEQPQGDVSFAQPEAQMLTAGYAFTDAQASATAYPTANPDTANTEFSAPVTTNLMENDKPSVLGSPLDGSSIVFKQNDGSFAKTLNTADGTYTANGDGTATFQPGPNFTGTTSPVTYQISDKAGMTATSTYVITVAAATNPTAVDDNNTTKFNTAVNTKVLENDKVAANGITWKSVELKDSDGVYKNSITTADGVYTVKDDNTVDFQPKDGFSGTAGAVDYRATDSNGKSAEAKLVIVVTDAVAPTATPDTNQTAFNTAVNTAVLTNDTLSETGSSWKKVELKDTDGAYKSTITTDDGVYTVKDDNTVDFQPKDGFSGTAGSVDYRATDSNGKTAESTLTITVADATSPAAVNDENTTEYETTVNTKVLDNDKLGQAGSTWKKVELKDAEGKLANTLTTADGVYTVKADNTVDFAPAAGFTGTAKPVTYVATDSNGKTAEATLTVVVKGIMPKATDDKATTSYNKPVVISILDNDTPGAKDAPLDPSTIVVTGKDASQGTWTVDTATGKVTFTPAKGFTGEATASYTVKDKLGNTVTANITVTVEKEVIEPTASGVDDHATTKQDTPVVLDVLGNDKSNPGTIVKNSTSLLDEKGAPSDSVKVKGGTFTLKDGQLVFTPEKGFYGESGTVTYAAASTDGVTYRAKASVTVTKADTPTPEKPKPTPEKPKPTPNKPTPTPEKPKPVTPGPVIQTDMAGGSSTDATGFAAMSLVAGAGALTALRRRKRD